MHNFPFDQSGKFYKGNIHGHTTNSDGALTPEGYCQLYRDHGYDFVAATDHHLQTFNWPVTDTSAFRDDHFTTLIGAELHGWGMENGELWHIVANGLPLDFAAPTPNETGQDIAARASDAGAFVVIGHPGWNGVTISDALSLKDFDAIEVYNYGHMNDCDRGNGWLFADVMANRGHRFSVTAGDDAHCKPDRPDSLGAWVHVMADSLEPEALLRSLKRGHFYSSNGPRIHHIELTGSEIVIECDPAIAIYAGGRGSIREFTRGDGLTKVRLPVQRFVSAYVRVTVLDAAGQRAWTNPIWLDELNL
ncbi:MAG: CehA/McbA family metallohydrolase [Thermomicrobiales bacterium]|nr:CehA/McbA family metallohydrolase [Thermomicrobiales bacterium]MCO5219685.1 CehA/McbA family metallohydrolase [Thermomicrobiales bacterium]MCO5225831.1 CehA/McbA family metallohydrolase [Thermomicrobiales bacterium]MCO5226531.1 CehA/McbA family metallohydrolase [Thermomicrobiales bacterium]